LQIGGKQSFGGVVVLSGFEYNDAMQCRAGCGACCIALSISSAIPGMPNGKPAGVRCVHLTEDNLCAIYDSPERPLVCTWLRPNEEMCGQNREEALAYLTALEIATQPDR
jgi:Fe-S-cluster containining protein